MTSQALDYDDSSALPLIAHQSQSSIIAYRDGQAISVGRFLHDATRLASTLTGGGYVLNTCQDRYRFAVGLAATVMSDRISLMPSTLVPETLNALQDIAPNYISLTDEDVLQITSDENDAPNNIELEIPLIEGSRQIAWVFTSGSTGIPVPHPKTWASLVTNVRIEAKRLGMIDGRSHTIIGTVPAQHMYGFESTVLVALQSGCAFETGKPFYPADICQAIASVPQPRLLITTPLHLNYLLSSDLTIPEVDLVVSATAPLSETMARETEKRLKVDVLEIYGCTETGQLATRRPTQSAQWQLFDGIQLQQRDGQVWASGGHVEQPVAMQDMLEITHDDYFLLHGRSSDIINIAGKRSSLAYLNHQLMTVPGIVDGTFFMPDEQEDDDKVVRLMAFVVAPELDNATLINELRERIDPAFMPRPIIFVGSLPRNATGKLPRNALVELAKNHTQQS
jgi:acyl-coenzyme A synthetase/AMP-(fatty) acid ligase